MLIIFTELDMGKNLHRVTKVQSLRIFTHIHLGKNSLLLIILDYKNEILKFLIFEDSRLLENKLLISYYSV